MPDGFARAVADPLRPARIFAPFFAVGFVAFVCVAAFGLVTAFGAEPDVVATGDGGRLALPAGANGAELTVYGASPSGGRPTEDARCELDTATGARAGFDLSGGRLNIGGQTLYRTGEVDAGWEQGDVLTCAGRHRLAVTSGSGAGPRLGLAALGAFGALVSAVLAVAGYASRRRRK